MTFRWVPVLWVMWFAGVSWGCERGDAPTKPDVGGVETAESPASPSRTGANDDAAAATPSAYDTEAWVTHTSSAGRWTADFPGAPRTQSTNIVFLSRRVDASEAMWTNSDKTEVFAVRWHDFARPRPPEPSTLVRVVEGFVAEMGLQQATRRPSSIGVLPAVDLAAKTRTGSMLVARVFATATAVVQVFAVSKDFEAARHFVTTLTYQAPQGGPVTYKLEDCDLDLALPAEPTRKSIELTIVGATVEGAHYVTNAPWSAVALGVICYPVLPEIQLDASPRQIVEQPLDALERLTGGRSLSSKTQRVGSKVVSVRTLAVPVGDMEGRIHARSEVLGDHAVVRYVSTPNTKIPDDRVVEFFLPESDWTLPEE